jgi:hypothetical protein
VALAAFEEADVVGDQRVGSAMKILTKDGEIDFDHSDVKRLRRHDRLKDKPAVEVALDLRSKGYVHGLMPAADFDAFLPKQEALWRGELEKLGPQAVRDAMHIRNDRLPVPSDFAVNWLSEKDIEEAKRERAAHWYLKWTFWAVLLTLLVALVGVPIERISAIWETVKGVLAMQ